MKSLYIYTEDIGGGVYIQHGFATIITAKKTGKNLIYTTKEAVAK